VVFQPEAALPVRLARGWIFGEKLLKALRDWKAEEQMADWMFVKGVLFVVKKPAIAVALLTVLYALVGGRIQTFCRVPAGH
jgi:hypothetical protein